LYFILIVLKSFLFSFFLFMYLLSIILFIHRIMLIFYCFIDMQKNIICLSFIFLIIYYFNFEMHFFVVIPYLRVRSKISHFYVLLPKPIWGQRSVCFIYTHREIRFCITCPYNLFEVNNITNVKKKKIFFLIPTPESSVNNNFDRD
jgi:hypothetical protein